MLNTSRMAFGALSLVALTISAATGVIATRAFIADEVPAVLSNFLASAVSGFFGVWWFLQARQRISPQRSASLAVRAFATFVVIQCVLLGLGVYATTRSVATAAWFAMGWAGVMAVVVAGLRALWTSMTRGSTRHRRS